MVQDVSNGLSNTSRMDELFDGDRGGELEYYLTEVCEFLGMAGNLTDEKADMEFMLGVVGSYLIAKQEGTLPEDTRPPRDLFNENLFPALDNMEEVDTEVIEEDE